MIEIVPATKEHINALYDEPPGLTLKAYAALDGDKVIGVAGVYWYAGNKVGFANFTEEIRKKPRVIVRGLRIMKEMLEGELMVICDPAVDKAENFLKHIGFEHTKNHTWVKS